MKSVVLLDHSLAHYRNDVFNVLRTNDNFKFKIVTSAYYQGVTGEINPNDILLKYVSFKIGKHTFYYLKKSIIQTFKLKPDLVIVGGYDIHMIHTTLFFILWRIILRRKLIWWGHGTQGKQGWLGGLFRSFFYRNSNGIMVYSKKGYDTLTNLKVNPDKIIIIANSNNVKDYGFLNYNLFEKPINTKLNMVYSGRITPSKKIDVLIDALNILKSTYKIDFECNIIGGGVTESMIKKIRELKLEDSISFIGEKYGNEIHTYFFNADLMAYPSGIGLSLVHSLSFGVPVITTNLMQEHGPEVELLLNGLNGDFFQSEDINDLAKKIVNWNVKIKESKNQILENCINSIKQNEYVPDKLVEKVINFVSKHL